MNLADYLPRAEAILDAESVGRLAVSVDRLRRSANPTHTHAGYDIVTAYARTTDPVTLTGAQAADVAALRRALTIIAGGTPLEGSTTYPNLRAILERRGGDIRDLADDAEALALFSRIAVGEPVLGRLIADGVERLRISGGASDPSRVMTLEDYRPDAEAALDSEPEGRLAISLERLRRSESAPDYIHDVILFSRRHDPETLTGQLAEDAAAVRRAIDIIAGRLPLAGMTYWTLQTNLGSLGASIYDFATDATAREIFARIATAMPTHQTGATA